MKSIKTQAIIIVLLLVLALTSCGEKTTNITVSLEDGQLITCDMLYPNVEHHFKRGDTVLLQTILLTPHSSTTIYGIYKGVIPDKVVVDDVDMFTYYKIGIIE